MICFKRDTKLESYISITLWIFILIYPLANSFLGMDLGDTGIHYMNFKYLFSKPEIVGYSSFFTSLVGWGWIQIFGNLGVWGLNLLEVFVEWGLAVISYKMLCPYFNKMYTLVGILAAILASGCYLNVFNYHQFSVLLIACMLYSIFLANTSGKMRYSLFAGILFGLSITARISSLSCAVCIILYFVWYLLKKTNLRTMLKNIFVFLISGCVICFLMLLIIRASGIWDAFISSFFRLGNMASSESSAYSINKLLNDFIFGNLYTLASGFLTLCATIMFSVGVYLFVHKYEDVKRRVYNSIVGSVVVFIAISIAIYSYDINPVEGSPQYTTGPNYMCGILYLTAIVMFLINTIKQNSNTEKSLIYLSSIFLPLLTVAGSNTQTKHIIISMWLIAPILFNVLGDFFFNSDLRKKVINKLLEKGIHRGKVIVQVSVIFFVFVVGYKFLHMVYWTNNFDSVNRLSLNSSVKSSVVKYLKTTSRQADSLNATIKVVDELKTTNKTNSLMVFGQGVMLYEILEGDPFIRPWITNPAYSTTDFEDELDNKSDAKQALPIVVYCRTNQYFGFEEEDYNNQIEMALNNNSGGKKEVLLKFLDYNDYKLCLQDDYYYVFTSMGCDEGLTIDEYRYIL